MRIGVIGPSDVKRFCEAAGIDTYDYIARLIDMAKTVASSGNDICIVPQKRSAPDIFSIEYRKSGGKKIIGVIPMDDTEFGIDALDQELVDEIINSVTWRNQPAKMAESCDMIICLGFGAGTLTEVFITKYFKSKVIVIEEFITQKLPKESERDLDIQYIRAEEVLKHIC